MKFFDSFWNPSFYKNKEGRFSFWKALVRLSVFYVVIGCVYAGMAYFSFVRHIPDYFASVTSKIENGYPEELVLSIKEGKLSKNISGPLYLYPFSDFDFKNYSTTSRASDTPEYLITIDDSQNVSLASYAASNASVFLGKDGFVIKNNKGIKVQPYSEIEGAKEGTKGFSFSKGMLTHGIKFVSGYIPIVPVLITTAVIITYPIGAVAGSLLFALFLALIVMLLSSTLIKRKVTYGESYVLALYALPSVVIVLKIASVVPYISQATSFPFVTTLLVVAFIWSMFKGNTLKEESITHGTL